ncbi:hypothetical protein ACPPVT_12500 [Angustibacter sp. McL0619]|uniref:hypothetical protein n=1 Tax=Angustibacter sp. McL0619 TaxID=3415676 RepID=UPI003CF61994
MPAKKAKSASAKKDKASIAKLRTELTSAESKRDKWKQRAIKAEASAADLRARLKTAEKAIKKAQRSGTAKMPVSVPAPVPASAADQPKGPDAGWTVAELRAEVRRRGLAGLSNKPKAELLAALA